MERRCLPILSLSLCLSLLTHLLFSAVPVHAAERSATAATEAVGIASAVDDSARPAANAPLRITFTLANTSSAAAEAFVNSLTDPSSPNYHKWITPTQFGNRFGASVDNIAQVTSALSKQGFFNIAVWPDRQFVTAQTTRRAAEAAFGVVIHGYDRAAKRVGAGESASYYAPDRLPILSSGLAGRVRAVFGLSNAIEARPAGQVTVAKPLVSAAGYFDPPDLAKAYDSSALHTSGLEGQGVTIAIYSPTAFPQSDISRFLTANGISAAKINVINVTGANGVSGNTSLTDQVEACIDIEIIAGQAPDATIDVYEAPNDGGFEIFQQVEKDDPNVLSMSYGVDENEVTAAYASSYENIRQAMAAEGISIFVAAGDSGAFDSATHSTITTSVDATSAYVTAVGGTELSPLSNGAWNGEVAWSYNDGTSSADTGSGGGLSKYINQPSWQSGPGVPNSYSNGMRQIPDVSALASTPYYDISTEGGWSGWGGTSCAAPLWAASLSLIEQSLGARLGNVDPKLYSIAAGSASPFHDITSGNDGLNVCTAGWDFVTGLGSVDFGKLLAAWTPPSAAVITSFTPISGVPGTSVTITGSGLSKATVVTFGGVTANLVSSNTASQIVVNVPSGALTGPIGVTSPQGSATSSRNFTVASPFSLAVQATAVTAAEGSSASTTVTLTNNSSASSIVTLSVAGLPAGLTASFSPTAISGASSSTVTFFATPTVAAGVYNVTLVGTSGTNASGVSVNVTVAAKQILSSIAVAPGAVAVISGSTQQFAATALDQFGNKLTSQPAFTWKTSGGGAIGASTGLFTAGASGGPYIVTATYGGVSGTSSVTINAAPGLLLSLSPAALTVKQGASGTTMATITPINGFSGTVSVGVSNLPAGVTVTASSSGSTVQFNLAASPTTAGGLYTVRVSAASGSISTAATLTLTISSQKILSSVTLSAATPSVALGGTDKLTATAFDQFGNALASQPSFTWTTTGGGAVNASTGLYTASTIGGPYKVTATAGGLKATTSITVVPPPSFTLAASKASLSLAPGASGTDILSLSAQNGFTGTAALTATGLPSGFTASFSPATIGSSTTSTLTLIAVGPMATKTYSVTLTGTTGKTVATVTILVTVT